MRTVNPYLRALTVLAIVLAPLGLLLGFLFTGRFSIVAAGYLLVPALVLAVIVLIFKAWVWERERS